MKTALKPCLCIVVVFAAPLAAQTIVSVDPNYAQRGESLGVIVYGSGTHFQDGEDMSIWLSQGAQEIYAYGYYPYSNTELIVWFDIPSDAETGLHDFNVYNDIDGPMTLYDGFTIDPGGIVSISPDNAQQGQSLSVVITGQDTHFEQGSPFQQGTPTEVWIGDTLYATNAWAVSDTRLVAEFDIPCDANAGLYDLSVYDEVDGTLIYYDGFTIGSFNPEISSVTPRGAYQGQSLSVTIAGQNTHFQPGSPTTNCFSQATPTAWFQQATPTTRNIVWFAQGSSTIFSSDCEVHGDTSLTARFDIPTDANTGLWDIYAPSVTDGVLTLPNGFIVVQPGDWTCDGTVNFFDLAVVAENWLEGADE